MANNPISADVREADARLAERRARINRTYFNRAYADDARATVHKEQAEAFDRLAALSRRAATQDAAIARLREALADAEKASKEADKQVGFSACCTLDGALFDLVAAAREVVGGGHGEK